MKEHFVSRVALKEKMAFGYYQLPVVVDTERYKRDCSTPVMGVWCPEQNDRSSLLTCSSCPQFGGMTRGNDSKHWFVRCRCAGPAPGPDDSERSSGVVPRARRLRLEDVWPR